MFVDLLRRTNQKPHSPNVRWNFAKPQRPHEIKKCLRECLFFPLHLFVYDMKQVCELILLSNLYLPSSSNIFLNTASSLICENKSSQNFG